MSVPARKELSAIKPYIPGSSRLPAAARAYEGPVFKLSANENPIGPSPLAVEAYQSAAASLARYPDGSALALREALAERYGLDPHRIMIGAGSDEIFQLLGRAYLEPGSSIVQSRHGFLVYRLVAMQSGAEVISAPETNLKTDVDAMLAAVREDTRMVFVANPNNPTGTLLSKDEVRRLHAGLPETVMLVLDGAYAEYVSPDDYDGALALAENAANVVMTRTFSKLFGLAALRVGWGYGPADVAEAYSKVRGPFNVTAPAIAAAAAALADEAHQQRSRDFNRFWLGRLQAAAKQSGFSPTDSQANFVLLNCAHLPGGAGQAINGFAKHGIVVRAMNEYGLNDHVRVSVGEETANQAVLAAMAEMAEENAPGG